MRQGNRAEKTNDVRTRLLSLQQVGSPFHQATSTQDAASAGGPSRGPGGSKSVAAQVAFAATEWVLPHVEGRTRALPRYRRFVWPAATCCNCVELALALYPLPSSPLERPHAAAGRPIPRDGRQNPDINRACMAREAVSHNFERAPVRKRRGPAATFAKERLQVGCSQLGPGTGRPVLAPTLRCTLHAPCTTPWHSFSGSPRALRRDTFNLNAPTLTTPGPKKIQKPSEPTYSWTALCGTLVIKYSNIENARPSSGVPQPRVSSVGLPKPKPDPPAPLPCGQP